MQLNRVPSVVRRLRRHEILFWLILLPFTIWGFRNTVSNGILYQLDHGKFHGDFSSALFNVGWIQAGCRWPEEVLSGATDVTSYGIFVRGIELIYGPFFTLLQYLLVDNTCPPYSLVSTPLFNPDTLLVVVTGINLILISVCIVAIVRFLYSTDLVDSHPISHIAIVCTLWLLDSHLGYSISVAAIPEILELLLILCGLLLITRPTRSSQTISGVLIALSALVKLVPAIFLPLLFFRRSHTWHRVTGFCATVGIVTISIFLGLGLSFSKAFDQKFGVPGELALTPMTHPEFRSLTSSIFRIINIDLESRGANIVTVSCVSIIGVMSFLAIGYTVLLRRRTSHSPDSTEPGLVLLIGLYISLLPLINIAHRHTYLFLIPTYILTFYAGNKLFCGISRIGILSSGCVLYLWISQSLVSSLLSRLGIRIPSILHEESLPNLGFSLLFVIMIYLYEKQKESSESHFTYLDSS